jgi:hypothetical protein
MKPSKTKVLFFIIGPTPTEADFAAADKLTSTRQQVVFRNAEQVSPTDGVERCDFVAGAVPAGPYSKVPRADKPAEAIASPAPAPALAPVEVAVAPAPDAAPIPSVATEPAPEAPAPAPEPAAYEVDESSTKAEIMEALTRRGLRYSSNANKTELLAILRE